MAKVTISDVAQRVGMLENHKDEFSTSQTRHFELIEFLMDKVNELESKVEALENRPTRDYGPKKENEMTDFMAWRIRFGDLKLKRNGGIFTAKEVATKYGLSNGQVYSVDGGYTFKNLNETTYTMDDVKAWEQTFDNA